jgi:hypothetical protein
MDSGENESGNARFQVRLYGAKDSTLAQASHWLVPAGSAPTYEIFKVPFSAGVVKCPASFERGVCPGAYASQRGGIGWAHAKCRNHETRGENFRTIDRPNGFLPTKYLEYSHRCRLIGDAHRSPTPIALSLSQQRFLRNQNPSSSFRIRRTSRTLTMKLGAPLSLLMLAVAHATVRVCLHLFRPCP